MRLSTELNDGLKTATTLTLVDTVATSNIILNKTVELFKWKWYQCRHQWRFRMQTIPLKSMTSFTISFNSACRFVVIMKLPMVKLQLGRVLLAAVNCNQDYSSAQSLLENCYLLYLRPLLIYCPVIPPSTRHVLDHRIKRMTIALLI